jgi:hypothetical protein
MRGREQSTYYLNERLSRWVERWDGRTVAKDGREGDEREMR